MKKSGFKLSIQYRGILIQECYFAIIVDTILRQIHTPYKNIFSINEKCLDMDVWLFHRNNGKTISRNVIISSIICFTDLHIDARTIFLLEKIEKCNVRYRLYIHIEWVSCSLYYFFQSLPHIDRADCDVRWYSSWEDGIWFLCICTKNDIENMEHLGKSITHDTISIFLECTGCEITRIDTIPIIDDPVLRMSEGILHIIRENHGDSRIL